MSWLSTRIEHSLDAAAVLIALAIASAGGTAQAQGFEAALMPGRVITGHAKIEFDCDRCHVPFERGAQPGLCLECHKHVARDVRTRMGHHGRIRERECRSCHTEHKGRSARIVRLDEKRFDHAITDFALTGRHDSTPCSKCHRPGSKHRATPIACAACHGKDDVHRGRLSDACANCHEAADWREHKFEHARTRFPLEQRHAPLRCAACHPDKTFTGAAPDCLGCHRKDDAHKGRFGARCAKCHDAADWKASTFRHERDTQFTLRDRHRSVKCAACHRGSLYQDKLSPACQACHRKDDTHRGALGEKCGHCHLETRWKASRFDHDRDSRFRLHGKHRQAKCEQCHRDPQFRPGSPVACVACHGEDDRARGHKGRYGRKCETCHVEDAWKSLRFSHECDTRYRLLGAHLRVSCDACHRGALYGEPTRSDCHGCHARDDRHKAQLGSQCERCHRETGWRDASFEHARSRFPLLGRHTGVTCKQCHATPAYRDARSECASCHARDDAHRARLGPRCEHCHDESAWKGAAFDHDRRTRFRLQGAHARTACVLCHTAPSPDRLTLTQDCAGCHAKRDDVHFGTLGAQCERCHVAIDWRKIVKSSAAPRTPASPGRAESMR